MPASQPALSGSMLRAILTRHAYIFAQKHDLVHALSDGGSPSVIFGPDEQGRHGNFHPAVHRNIRERADWAERLEKVHTSSRRMKVRSDWQWKELDCAHSSDALLMNFFCHPAAFHDGKLSQALNVRAECRPEFGFRARVPLRSGLTDQTEVDMKLGSLLVEAKLTESGFPAASLSELLRYRDFDDAFSVNELPRRNGKIEGYQLVRTILAALAHDGDFCLICDVRRADLIETAFRVTSAIRRADLRCRVKIATWQELLPALPRPVQSYLRSKYGFASLEL